jgi:predicted Rossmann-fold nucleotide-binding protein
MLVRRRRVSCLRGCFGTLDELFESLVLIQTGKILHFPVVLVGSEHWHGLRSWMQEKLIDEKLIAPRTYSFSRSPTTRPRRCGSCSTDMRRTART